MLATLFVAGPALAQVPRVSRAPDSRAAVATAPAEPKPEDDWIPYEEGMPARPSYHLEDRRRAGLIGGGAVLVAFSAASAVTAAVLFADAASQPKGSSDARTMDLVGGAGSAVLAVGLGVLGSLRLAAGIRPTRFFVPDSQVPSPSVALRGIHLEPSLAPRWGGATMGVLAVF